MQMFLISDNIDTYTGMRLAGVEGVVVHTHDELKDALESYDKLYKDKFEITLLSFLFYENCEMIIEFKNYDKIIDSIKKYND